MLPNILTTAPTQFSEQQTRALLAADPTTVVTAGAGAGKTRTLVARYLALLAEGLSPRQVTAITFTNKAAREMRNRVRQEIGDYLRRPNLPPDDSALWQAIYRELDAARIGTIHSLCAEILRSHPAEAGLDPRFELLDEGRSAIARGQAVDDALAEAAGDPAMQSLFAGLGERRLRLTLADLLARRLDALAAFAGQPANLLDHWRAKLSEWQQQALARLEANPDWAGSLAILRDNAARKEDDRMEVQRRVALALFDAAAGDVPERLAVLAHLDSINLVGGAQGGWPGGKFQLEAVKAALRTLRELWRANASLLGLALNPQDERLAELLPPLHNLFLAAAERYRRQKEAGHALDFDDLEAHTLALLQTHADVRAYWQRALRVILVDEFQDTNRRQSDLIDLLRGPDSRLFVVGDAKQSIYRFRGADVSVYRHKQAAAGQLHELSTSYRAHARLIDTLNQLLGPVLGAPAADLPDFAAPFAPLGIFRRDPKPGLQPPFLELHLAVGSKSEGALERSAQAVAGRLRQMIAAGEIAAGDVAILCRASTAFAAYENALEAAGLPFLTVAGRGFYHRPEIRDVLNALQAVADPADDLALAGLLRSPVVGLSDMSLLRLADTGAPSLWAALGQAQLGLPPDEGERAAWAVTLIEALRGLAGKTAIADVLKAFLDRTHYRAALLAAGQSRAARNVSKLLADAHASGMVGVSDFLEYVANLRDSGSREGEARAIAEGVVQIMSVHAAKGLEFPVVVLGDAAGSGRSGGGLLLDAELGVLLPLVEEDTRPAVVELGRQREAERDDAESRRLLYVAATRAEEKLIFSANVGLKNDGRLTGLGQWLGWLAEPLGLDGVQLDLPPDSAAAVSLALPLGECAIYPPGWVGEAAPAAAPESAATDDSRDFPLLVSLLRETVAAEPDELPARVWQVAPPEAQPFAPAWVIGQLVHEALAAWRFPDGDFAAWAAARGRAYGLADRRQLEHAARASEKLLRRFAAHPLRAELDRAELRRHEVPFSYLAGGEFRSGQIDLLARMAGRWQVIEFKTDHLPDEAALARRLAEKDYLAQIGEYEAAVAALTNESPLVRLCLLDFAGGVRLLTAAEAAEMASRAAAI